MPVSSEIGFATGHPKAAPEVPKVAKTDESSLKIALFNPKLMPVSSEICKSYQSIYIFDAKFIFSGNFPHNRFIPRWEMAKIPHNPFIPRWDRKSNVEFRPPELLFRLSG